MILPKGLVGEKDDVIMVDYTRLPDQDSASAGASSISFSIKKGEEVLCEALGTTEPTIDVNGVPFNVFVDPVPEAAIDRYNKFVEVRSRKITEAEEDALRDLSLY